MTLSVLVADDDPLVRRALVRTLARAYDVTAVGAAEEALALIDAGRFFDAIVSDLHMGAMSGIDLYEELLARWPAQAARFILVSGTSLPAEHARATRLLGERFLRKPLSVSSLLEALERVTRPRR